jgi:hypothetical protein
MKGEHLILIYSFTSILSLEVLCNKISFTEDSQKSIKAAKTRDRLAITSICSYNFDHMSNLQASIPLSQENKALEYHDQKKCRCTDLPKWTGASEV